MDLNKRQNFRIIAVSLVFLSIMMVYGFRLMDLQMVLGESYLAAQNQGSVRTQTTVAARGEIVDRNGTSLIYNEIGYNVEFDRAMMTEGINNDDILWLTDIFREHAHTWLDTLPISTTSPFTFSDNETEVSALKSFLGIENYADAEDAMHWLSERYQLGEYSDIDARTIAGIRYGMERGNFSMSTRYIFALDIELELVIYLSQISGELEGLTLVESPVREYSYPEAAPHVLGHISPIFASELEYYLEKGYQRNELVGVSGIERAYEDVLKGQNGETTVHLNAANEVIDIVETLPPQPGNTVQLTLDIELQQTISKALEDQIAYLNEYALPGEGKEADAGAAVVVDVQTGEILAMATYPSYDATRYNADYSALNSDPLTPLFNRATQGIYSPGSIFKPSVSVAGLSEGVINSLSTVSCQMVYDYYPSYQPTCLGYHGNITVTEALRHSCNVFFYDTGRLLGMENINSYARALGLGISTGIEIPEYIGFQNDESSTNPGDVLQAAIGQLNNGYTPIQYANYAATLARKGELKELTLVKSITDFGGEEVLYSHTPQTVDNSDIINVSDISAFDTVIGGMVEASRIGTAASYFGYNVFPIDVASKTGTPQTSQYDNSTFIAFAPVDEPKIAVAVVIENGWHGYTGAPVAVTAFEETLLSDGEYSIGYEAPTPEPTYTLPIPSNSETTEVSEPTTVQQP